METLHDRIARHEAITAAREVYYKAIDKYMRTGLEDDLSMMNYARKNLETVIAN